MDFQKKTALNLQDFKSNSYPGRGIIMGLDESAENVIQIYFLTGRSERTRNRELVHDGTTVKAQLFDPSAVEDPFLLIYDAMVEKGDYYVVANGDHIDAVVSALTTNVGPEFKKALSLQEYEKDSSFTPRICAMYDRSAGKFYFSQIVKSKTSDDSVHLFNEYDAREKGLGFFIRTYEKDGNPLESYRGKPLEMPLKESFEEIKNFYWDFLDKDNRMCLVVKSINISTGKSRIEIINKLKS